MFAIVQAGGRQLKVAHGQTVRIDRVQGEPGSSTFFNQVLMIAGGPQVHLGQPALEGVRIEARILEHGKADKVLIFRKRRRKNYRRKRGFRAQYTLVRIQGLQGLSEQWEVADTTSGPAPQA